MEPHQPGPENTDPRRPPDPGEGTRPTQIIRIKDVIENLQAYLPTADVDLIEKAYVYSAMVHVGQVRLSGEPYLVHPLAVANILTTMRVDEVCVATGLLHDTVEDTYATIQEIENQFGPEIAALVDGLTKISKIHFSSREEQQAENFRKMILAMAKDIRVILIKLADRLHNLRTLQYLSPDKRIAIAQETLDIYAPIANRLGIGWMKTQLEDLSLQYLHPDEFADLAAKIEAKKEERNRYVEEVKKIITEKLSDVHLEEEVSGRLKSYYSIYKKMLRQRINFDQVYDLIAFRVIVGSIKDCYQALGNIHSVWKPVPGRFKDHIAMPKSNMYQSLHTTVIGPYGERMEVQIRTLEMHRIAEEGIAAHWRYKEGRSGEQKDDERFAWLRQILEWQQELRDPKEFMETFRIDLFPQEVYVFTPHGDVKVFPRGATPIDFAYSIHSDVGDRCVGARANSRMVPLSYQMQNGDTIEIITAARHAPSKDWLNIVKTSRAQTKIRQWIRQQQREDNIRTGKHTCEREFKKFNLYFNSLFRAGKITKAAEELDFPDAQELLAAIGIGKLPVGKVIQKLVSPEVWESRLKSLQKKEEETKKRERARNLTSGIQVLGLDDVLVHFAKCCDPLPGDEIGGFITRGRGVTIHVLNCPRFDETDHERRVDVSWDPKQEINRPVKIKVLCHDQKGLLAELSGAISRQESNIRKARVETTPEKQGLSIFEVEVKTLAHLNNVIQALEKIKGVIQVNRMRTGE